MPYNRVIVIMVSGMCTDLPEIDHLKTEVRFPILIGTVIDVRCDHPWVHMSGDQQITCTTDRQFRFHEKPSCKKGKLRHNINVVFLNWH